MPTRSFVIRNWVLWLILSTAGWGRLWGQAGLFTVQTGSVPLPPSPLVNHWEDWRYRLGTNAPSPGWQTNGDAPLDSTWLSGPGGFGYGDGDDATGLQVMSNLCTTLYIRQSLEVTEVPDPGRMLTLLMDYDDGFVAWLNGVHVARSTNAPGAPGSEPAHNAVTLATQNHEALGYRGLPPETYDLGWAGDLLHRGTNVLAVMGLNAALNSSDFSLIADLHVTGGHETAAEGVFFTLVRSNSVSLWGSNTVPGSTRVVVNGLEADYDPATGVWSQALPLTPGVNRLFLAALDANGAILAATNKLLVSETATVSAGGTLAGDATWSRSTGVIRVTNNLVVPDGVTLSIDEGVVVLLAPSVSIRAQTHGTVAVAGTEANPVVFLPADGTTPWRELSATGSNAVLTLQHAEVVAGQVICSTNSVVTIQDSLLRDYHVAGRLFVTATNGQQLTLRRTHVARYDQCRFTGTPVLIEDCLFERIGSDATDFADHADIVVRRTTYRFGSGAGTDAVDLGGNPGMVVDSCLIHDFPDKGVSIAGLSHGTVVTNSLIYNTGIGISAYAASNCLFVNNTIATSTTGVLLRERDPGMGAGHGFATNNIVWDVATNISLLNGATLEIAYSDIDGLGLYPGTGNINADPLFVDAARADFRLGPGSPAIGAGQGGVNQGPAFPVGGIPAAPFNLAAAVASPNQIRLFWEDDADNEAGFAVERATDGVTWQSIGAVAPNVTQFLDPAAAWDQPYFYRVRATNHAGASRFSNLASQILSSPKTVVGGTLTNDAVWAPALGTILVLSPVTVPSGLTLAMEPGTTVRLTNSGAIQAVAGGAIHVTGTADNPVAFAGLSSNQMWGGLSAIGSNASLEIRYADIQGGHVGATNGATLLLEDSYLHEFKVPSGHAIGGCENAAWVTVRRCHFNVYHETLWRGTLMTIEDTLFENANNANSDTLDFDGAAPGSVLRRCTFRHGPESNTDAIDLGPGVGKVSVGVRIEDCLMYDFPHDGGISAGEGVWGLVVSNCLIYGCKGGIKAKETGQSEPTNPTTLGVYRCTIVDNYVAGLSNFLKSCGSCQAGRITNAFNNIVYGNPADVVLLGEGVLTAEYSNFGDTNFLGNGTFNIGPGVISADPLFVNADARDYRLRPNSPCIGTGREGATMGCHFPVGAPMAPSHPSIDDLQIRGDTATAWFWADSERSYSLQSCDDLTGGAWQSRTNVSPRARPTRVGVTDRLATSHRFYRLVTPQRP